MSDHPILFLPGPTEVEAELRQLMAQPVAGHRSAGFVEQAQDVRKGRATSPAWPGAAPARPADG